jgi:hypothetical protein
VQYGIMVVGQLIILRLNQMEIRNSYPKLSTKKILEKFSLYGLTPPKEYTNFLEKYNGGYPEVECEYVDKEDDEYTIPLDCFYGISDTDTSISIFARRGFLSGSLPNQLLPIAGDGIGNEICLGVEGEFFGKVYFWNKDGEAQSQEELNFSNVELITDSFDLFLLSLTPI